MATSLKDISKVVFDWALPLPPNGEIALKQSVQVWRWGWTGVLVFSFLLGWVPLLLDPGDWRAYLNYEVSALFALAAIVFLPLSRPLQFHKYWHGVVPMSVYGFSAPVITWIASALNPEQLLKVVPKYGDILGSFAVKLHLTGVQSGYKAPVIVLKLAIFNALLGFGTFLFQRLRSRKTGLQR